jgi:hypothetical protein
VSAKLKRIQFFTLGATNVADVVSCYSHLLDYVVLEQGMVNDALAQSWGCPLSAERGYVHLAAKASPGHILRVVEIDTPSPYPPFTAYGWNAIEIIVDDLAVLAAKLDGSVFKILAPPAPIPMTSLHAMQVQGPAGEVLYLTTETGDRAASTLPIPQSQVCRPFVAVIAGPDVMALREYYATLFALEHTPIFPIPIPMIAKAQNMPEQHPFPITVLRGAERGNAIELDGYPVGLTPRVKTQGQLPPGVAMISFAVDNLDSFHVPYRETPKALYGNKRAATFVGPVGELIELIED